ncbi:Acyl_transf_3 domain-containing protein, partial [Meloidogyne graminicola]
FFVISGHLIAKCLNKNIKENCNFSENLLTFYKRRIKRIVPIYLFVIFITASFSRILMLESDFKQAMSDMYWSLCFAMNIKLTLAKVMDYFSLVFDYRPLLHMYMVFSI